MLALQVILVNLRVITRDDNNGFYILHSTFYILHSTFYILHSTFYILHSTVILEASRCLRRSFVDNYEEARA